MRMTSVFLTLLMLFTIVSAMNLTREERDIHPKDKKLIVEIRNRLEILEKNLQSRKCFNGTVNENIGAVYTRWGRTTCLSNGTELLYSGYAGGSHYSHRGAAANHLCLPSDPQWRSYTDGHEGHKNFVYGAEYETVFKFLGSSNIHDHDVPCAVCRTKGRSSVYMIPAKTNCTKGWTVEYSGYLMAGYHNHAAATEYVCVDKKPQVVAGSSSDNNGALFYMVEATCGPLPCKPYVDGRELTCVVCSK